MQQTVSIFDHPQPTLEHLRILFFKDLFEQLDFELILFETVQDLELSLTTSKHHQLYLIHSSEYQPQKLSSLGFNPNAHLLFYSGAGFNEPTDFPETWLRQILFLRPSIDFVTDELRHSLKELLALSQNDPIHPNGRFYNLEKTHPSIAKDRLWPSTVDSSSTPEHRFMQLHHDMKSLVFKIKALEQQPSALADLKKEWTEHFETPLLALRFDCDSEQNKLCKLILNFKTWLSNSDLVSNLSGGIETLKNMRMLLYTQAHLQDSKKTPYESLFDFHHNHKKIELWVACFNPESVSTCESLLSHLNPALHFNLHLGPKNSTRAHYQTSHELLDELNNSNPEKLIDTYLLIFCNGPITDLLNCGHQRNIDRSYAWKMNRQTHLGLLAQVIMQFPQLNTHVIYTNTTLESAKSSFVRELKISVPDTVEHCDEIITNAFDAHFFHLNEQTPNLYQSISNFLRGNRYLFDPTGLRTLFKCRLVANVFSGSNPKGELDLINTLEQRRVLASRLNHLCITIDEDLSSATFHSYASYRYGWRAWTVTTFNEFDQPHVWKGPAKHKLVIRDTDLRFPDINAREPYRQAQGKTNVRYRLECVHSDLWSHFQNQSHDPKLDSNWQVRVITADHEQVSHCAQDFKSHLEISKGETFSILHHEFVPPNTNVTSEKPKYLGISKPFNSFYDLSQLWGNHHAIASIDATIAARLTPAARLEEQSGHFAPYINLPLAEQLLSQVKRCKEPSDQGWILCAILAAEADELLLGMSEYSGLEAIRFLHRSEVMAEIESIGFSGKIRINHRKKEILRLVQVRYPNDRARQDQFLSRFWDDLRTLYKGAEQFQASEQANIESFSKRKWLYSFPLFSSIEEFLRRTIILCASSLRAWGACWLVSNFVFMLLYRLNLPQHLNLSSADLFFQVYSSSLIGEPSFGLTRSLDHSLSSSLQTVVFLHFGCSYLLFGFFLSMIYRKITRS